MKLVEYEEVVLPALKVATQSALTGQFLASNADLRMHHDFMRDELVFQLTSYVLSEEVPGEWRYTYYVPASWWDHFKLAWPRWLERRFPARFESRHATRILDYNRTWPHAALAKTLGPTVLKVAP